MADDRNPKPTEDRIIERSGERLVLSDDRTCKRTGQRRKP